MRRLSKQRLVRWNESAGGIFFPSELETMEDHYLKDKCKTHGVLSIFAYPEGHREAGRLLELESGRTAVENLIVDLGRGTLATLSRTTAAGLAPAAVIGVLDLGYLAVGRGSAGGASLPAAGSVALYTESTAAIIPRPLLIVTTPPPGPPFMVNLWSAQIGTTQLNAPPGSTINEAGIFCLDQTTLFSFRTFANQTKAAGYIFEFRWAHIF